MGVCFECPFAATLASAEQLIDQNNSIESQKALGGIALTRKSLETVANNLECDKPFKNTVDGQLACPLQNSAMGARAYAFAPWNQSQYTVRLEDQASPYGSGTYNGGTGQYL